MAGDYEPTPREMADLRHRFEHLLWRNGQGLLPESGYVAECWLGAPPDWAIDRATQGHTGDTWCPLLMGRDHDDRAHP